MVRAAIDPLETTDLGDSALEDAVFRELVEGWMDAVLIVEVGSESILFANRAAARQLGYEPQTLVGLRFEALFAEANTGSAFWSHADAFDGVLIGQPFRRANGQTVTLDLSCQLLESPREASPREGTVVVNLRDARERVHAEVERNRLIAELRTALDQVKTLRGLLPICCVCKMVRDDDGYWQHVEHYVSCHTDADFSHGLCPDCFGTLSKKYVGDE